jgi:hypothetical protein
VLRGGPVERVEAGVRARTATARRDLGRDLHALATERGERHDRAHREAHGDEGRDPPPVHEEEQQTAEGDRRGPRVEDQHGVEVRVPHVEQSVVQVFAVG